MLVDLHLESSTRASLATLLGSDSDGELGILGSLGTPDEDGSTSTEGDQSIEVFTASQSTSSALEELGLETVVTLLVLLAIQIPASDGVFEVLY